MILCSSDLNTNTMSTEEKDLLISYVSSGGILIASRVSDEYFFPLFGVSGLTESNTNYTLNWNHNISSSLLRWINEPEEWTVSLGRESQGSIFKTYSYNLTNAIPLATYENQATAVTQNGFGTGFTYVFGMAWKEVILRSEINRDFEAQRITSNGFEPTQDVFMLMIRAIFCEHIPYSVWKHSSLTNSTSTLMITHDIDSNTALDTMAVLAESEKTMGITATYNITVRYFNDALMDDFYNGSDTKIQKIIDDGHVLGSHTVGHFFDFGDDIIFPIGNSGNTMENYHPYNDGIATTGGTVFGECEVSKNVLESDHNQKIRVFRTGHLVFNTNLVSVLQGLGYLYNSSFSANAVLTNFPYQCRTDQSFTGVRSSVYELPVSISDVYQNDNLTEDNYIEKADNWLEVISKIDDNNASTVLLIHPNREYKLLGQEYFLANLPADIRIEEMSAFGDFWKDRETFEFITELMTGNALKITLMNQNQLLNQNISLIINNGKELTDIVIQNENGQAIGFVSENWSTNDLLLYDFNFTVGTTDLFNTNKNDNILNLNIFPNPVYDIFNIELNLKIASEVVVELVDIYGKTIKTVLLNSHNIGHQNISFKINDLNLTQGIYFCKINAGLNGQVIKKVFLR